MFELEVVRSNTKYKEQEILIQEALISHDYKNTKFYFYGIFESTKDIEKQAKEILEGFDVNAEPEITSIGTCIQQFKDMHLISVTISLEKVGYLMVIIVPKSDLHKRYRELNQMAVDLRIN